MLVQFLDADGQPIPLEDGKAPRNFARAQYINPTKRQLKEACRRASKALGRKLTKRERARAAELIKQHHANG